MSTPTTPQNQTPTTNNPTRKLATALAIAAVLALLLIGYILTNKSDPKPASAPTPTGSVIYNQAPTTTPNSPAPQASSTIIGGTKVNGQPLYTAPAASVTKFCKAWATASAGKETFLKNIEPYVTSDVLEGLKDTDLRNLTTDNPTLTNIVINPVPGTERTYNAYCVYNREAFPRYGGTFTSTDGSEWVLSEPNDPADDPQVLADKRPTPARTSNYDLNYPPPQKKRVWPRTANALSGAKPV